MSSLVHLHLTDTGLVPDRLNLGCGQRKLDGYWNVDKYGDPDQRIDLDVTPWPWQSDSFVEVTANHVLEHLGQQTAVFLSIMQELYRVCRAGAQVHVVVPHPRHEAFLGDPTHVRAITPACLSLFSKSNCRRWDEAGNANTRLADYLNVDFTILGVYMTLDPRYRADGECPIDDPMEAMKLERSQNNVVEEYRIEMEVIK